MERQPEGQHVVGEDEELGGEPACWAHLLDDDGYLDGGPGVDRIEVGDREPVVDHPPMRGPASENA